MTLTEPLVCLGTHWLTYQFKNPEAAGEFARSRDRQRALQVEMHRLGHPFTLLAWPGCREPIRIEAQAIAPDLMGDRVLHTALGSWSRSALETQMQMINSEVPMGMNRILGGEQVALNSPAVAMLGDNISRLIGLVRAEYWHPASLRDLEVACRDRGGSHRGFEFQYRARFRGGWAKFRTHYRLVDDRYTLGRTVAPPEPCPVPEGAIA